VDRFIRLSRTKLAVQVLTCRSLPSKTICLELSRPLSFRYRAGQYLFLNIPSISTFEYHPFTITSAPEEGQLRLHIRAVGDWTEKVRNLVLDTDALASSSVINNDENDEGRIEPDNPLYLARIDGPYGAPTEELFRYRYAVFVGAGIGATPASSILRSVQYRMQNRGGCSSEFCNCECACCRFKCEKLYFYWINRDTDGFEWFAAMLADIKKTDVNDMVEVRCFMTR
jgi:hypothetical protein